MPVGTIGLWVHNATIVCHPGNVRADQAELEARAREEGIDLEKNSIHRVIPGALLNDPELARFWQLTEKISYWDANGTGNGLVLPKDVRVEYSPEYLAELKRQLQALERQNLDSEGLTRALMELQEGMNARLRNETLDKIFDNSRYTRQEYDDYLARKQSEGQEARSPQEYIDFREHWRKGGGGP